MKPIAIALLLFSFAVHAEVRGLPEFQLTLKSQSVEETLNPVFLFQNASDPQIPSCLVFRFRKQQVLKQGQEMDSLLAELNRGHGQWSASQKVELEQLIARQADVERELKSQTVQIVARFEWPSGAQGPIWFGQKRYRLNIASPSLTWSGFNSSEPMGFSMIGDRSGITVSQKVYLTDACTKPVVIHVRLEEI